MVCISSFVQSTLIRRTTLFWIKRSPRKTRRRRSNSRTKPIRLSPVRPPFLAVLISTLLLGLTFNPISFLLFADHAIRRRRPHRSPPPAGPIAQQDYHLAISLFTQAIALNPNEPVFWSNRAAARMKLEEYGGAVADCSESSERASGR